MSVTRYYTGEKKISDRSGDFSTTDSFTPNYTDGWMYIGSDTFSVPSSGNLPSGVPGNSNDVDLSDANEVMLVTVEIKDINMLSATGVQHIPSYPFCIFPKDFNVLNDWSGLLYRGRNTAKIKDYDSEADARADATLARPDTWVWYDGKWVSLIGNNPEDTFDAYGTNSSGQTEYFRHTTSKESGIESEDLRYVERSYVRLSNSTISSKFVTTYNGTRCAMMLLIPFKATEFTQDAVGLSEDFSSAQFFYAVDDIGGTLYNVDTPNNIPTYYNTQNDSTEWTRLPGFYRNVSNVQSDMPYFKKAKTYTYLTAFNVSDVDKYDIRKCFRSSYMGDTEYITSANWIVPYQRKYSRSVPESTSFSTRTFYYVYWNDETGEWDISESQVVASTEKRLLGVILQAPGGNGGPGATASAGSGGGAGGGGGAYGEFMVNAYNNYIRVTLAKRANTGDGSRATAAPSEIEVSDGTNRIQMQCTAGAGGEKGIATSSSNPKGGAGGYVQFSTNGGTNWSTISDIYWGVSDGGDKDLVKWYSPSGRGTFSWDVACIGVIAAIQGGKGGDAYGDDDGDNGATLSIIRGYNVTGVPSRSLRWSRGLENLPDNYKPYDTTYPGSNAGKGGVSQVDYAGGGGGGASYYGKGGQGDTYKSNPAREEGIKGGGSGGSAASHTEWANGSSGVVLLLK